MPIPRKEQINLDATPYYHCISRCVQQCFLLGKDKQTSRNYAHRRAWVEARILLQSRAFAIEVCAYAVMSNHLHLVLKVDKEKVSNWSAKEVCERWQQISKLPALLQSFIQAKPLSDIEKAAVQRSLSEYRKKLCSISHFMGMLNWHIARRANREEGRKGHFWEGRFYSQALLGEAAVVACMAYVDLNPIRAGASRTLENALHTSIFHRLQSVQKGQEPRFLRPFAKEDGTLNMPCSFSDYLAGLKEAITQHRLSSHIPLIESLGLSLYQWRELTRRFEYFFDYAAGSHEQLRLFKQSFGKTRIRGQAIARILFG